MPGYKLISHFPSVSIVLSGQKVFSPLAHFVLLKTLKDKGDLNVCDTSGCKD